MSYYAMHVLMPFAIFFLLHKLFVNKKPKPRAIFHCLAIFFLIFLVTLQGKIGEFFVNNINLSAYALAIVHNIILPLILFYALFFRENKDYDELLKKDIWQNWIDEPVHKKEGL